MDGGERQDGNSLKFVVHGSRWHRTTLQGELCIRMRICAGNRRVWTMGLALMAGSVLHAQGSVADGWHVLGKEGRGLLGTVTAVHSDHYSVKTEKGVRAEVYFSANTRMVDQHLPANAAQPVDCLAMAEAGQLEGTLQPVKPEAIRRRDVIMAGGRVDAKTGDVGAVVIARLDPVCARQAQRRAKEYGKTWVAGRVTAISGNELTLETVMDPALVRVVLTDATVLKRQESAIPVSALVVGDSVRIAGSRAHGVFTAKTIAVMRRPPMPRPRGGPVLPHGGEPPQ